MNADLADETLRVRQDNRIDRITGWTGLTGLRGFGGRTESCHPAAEKIRVNPVLPSLGRNHSMRYRRLATLLGTDGAANPSSCGARSRAMWHSICLVRSTYKIWCYESILAQHLVGF